MITGGGTGMEEESIIIDDDSLASAFVLYRQMVPTNIVIETLTKMETWPSPVAQEAIHKKLFQHPFEDTFPPASDYRARFIRRLNAVLEEEGEEVIDAILRDLNQIICHPKENTGISYVSFFVRVPSSEPPSSQQQHQHQHQHPHHVEPLVIRVAPQENDVGLRLWEAGYVLADYLLDNSHIIKDCEVIELGAGVGLVGLLCAYCLEAKSVIVTDSEPEVLQFLGHNIEANATIRSSGLLLQQQQSNLPGGDDEIEQQHREEQEECRIGDGTKVDIKMASLDWSQVDDYQAVLGGEGNQGSKVLLAADCIYDHSVIHWLVNVLAHALRPSPHHYHHETSTTPSMALISSTMRNPATYQLFLSSVEEAGLDLEDITPTIPATTEWPLPQKGGRPSSSSSPFYCPNRKAVRLVKITWRDSSSSSSSSTNKQQQKEDVIERGNDNGR